MIEQEQVMMLVYQHICQLTIAGESVREAFVTAYDVAHAVFDDVAHEANLRSARDRAEQPRSKGGEVRRHVGPQGAQKDGLSIPKLASQPSKEDRL